MTPIFEWIFDHNFGRYPSLNERQILAQASGLTYRQIVVWVRRISRHSSNADRQFSFRIDVLGPRNV
jgi:hypothetical protein